LAHQLSRRELLRCLPVPLVVPLLAEQSISPRPFRVSIPQATVDRILHRVKDTRLPDRLDAPDWRYGANWDYMKSLADYWTTRFDWRKAEASLNRYPQFLVRAGDSSAPCARDRSSERDLEPCGPCLRRA
jgi:epoxide hydrolase